VSNRLRRTTRRHPSSVRRACSDSSSVPAAPSAPAQPSNAPTVLSVITTGSAPIVGASAQFTATANLTNGSTQNVSAQATWQSSNAVVAGVNATGLVTGVAAGDVDITATYLGMIGRARITIVRPLYTVSGRLTDGTSGGVLPNIHLAIGDGINVGRTATTDSAGQYAIGSVAPGTFTLTASATSYQTTSKTITVSGDTTVDFVLPRTPSAATPAPNPAPPVPPTRRRLRRPRREDSTSGAAQTTRNIWGFFTCIFCNEFASESINNQFGSYGSPFSSTSIRNEFSQYGSQFSSLSACNEFASTPPRVYNSNRSVYYGELTVNQFRAQGIKGYLSWLVSDVCRH